MIHVSQKMVSISLAALVLSACGKMKQDPTSEYKDVRDQLVTSHDTKSRVQGFRGMELFDIAPAEGKFLNFVEGQAATYRIESRVSLSGVVYDVSLSQQPEGMTLAKTDETGVYLLSWTPPTGPQKTDMEIVFELVLQPGTDARALSIFNNPTQPIERKRRHQVHIRRAEAQAVISKIEGLKDGVQEGEEFAFQIEVTDPLARPEAPPRLLSVEVQRQNGDLRVANGASFIRTDLNRTAPERTATGTWVFHRIFDTKIAAVPQPLNREGRVDASANEVTVGVAFMVAGSAGAAADEKSFNVKIRLDKKAEAPMIRFATGKQSIELETGLERDIEISAFVTNPRAKVDINSLALREAISAWPGHPTLSCEDSGRDQIVKNCVLTWKVPCNDSSLKNEYLVSVEATSTLYDKSVSAKMSKTLKIVKRSENCRSAMAAAPARESSTSPQSLSVNKPAAPGGAQ